MGERERDRAGRREGALGGGGLLRSFRINAAAGIGRAPDF